MDVSANIEIVDDEENEITTIDGLHWDSNT